MAGKRLLGAGQKSVSEKEAAEWLYVERAKQNTSAEQPEQNEAESFTSAFSQQKRSRIQTFDLHPDIPMSERHTFDLAFHEVPEAGKKNASAGIWRQSGC